MKFRMITITGVVLILCGGILLGYWRYTDFKYRQMYSSAVDDSEITENDFTKMLKESRKDFVRADDSDVDEYIEFSMLDADQEVDEVTLYSNVLEIPQFDIIAYIGKDTEKETLKRGVGWHNTTAKPGHIGNCVIPGHSSSTYDCIFNGIENIGILDTFIIWDEAGIKHVYYVTDKYVTDPYNLDILHKPVTGISQTTLYTCTEHGTRRLVIVGKEFDDYDLEKFKAELDRQFGERLSSLAASESETGLSKFLTSWGKELPVSHIALPLVEDTKLDKSHKYLYANNQQNWFKKNPHIFDETCYVTNFYFNLWKFEKPVADDEEVVADS